LVFPSGDGFNAGGAPPYYNNGWQTFYGCTKIFLDSVPEGIVDSISGNIEPGASIPIARTAP
jgi:hypothetical protein